ncbi:phage tail protein [Serratia marcescens]|uniref:Phage tail fibre repeat n=3 Tax=Pseudomonadota TaxID=1224 RepID=A0A379YIQ6_SERMA|nr:phage tail protein [Serratia marcescens]KFD15150.1 phage tail fiber protein [Serratia marcescens subsp. marcescens ATCC 13880]KFL02929.1 phage tail fiber repeat family protein [Serratia marcescens]MCC3249152.1 phage tail protein [Serratia marcescens]UIM54953.1 phage tail protein [Serratia marcescens]WQD47587.1 phage tail protein [Serratia marcescens subsp. marcescens ATCC 13880]
MSKYKAIITTAGAAKIAAASAGGTQLKIVSMAVGDGNGTLPTPNPAQTKLVNEKCRAALNGLTIDKALKNHILAEMIIPANVGGFWLREMGLYDEAGTLIAVSNMAESYKPKLEEGSGRTQTLRMILIVSSTEAIQVIAGGDTVLATKDFVADAIAVHEKTRNHPDASTTAKGLVQLSSATTSTDETKASTPKALKTVSDASMKKAANLSDLPDKAAARGNLALGTAATKNVGVAGGQLMEVGAFGLGSGSRHREDAYCNQGEIYRVNGSSKNAPGGDVYGVLSLPCDGGPSGAYMAVQNNGNAFFGRSNIAENGVTWFQAYTTKFKPTAADVGAWSKKESDGRFVKQSGDTMSGPLALPRVVFPNENTANADTDVNRENGFTVESLVATTNKGYPVPGGMGVLFTGKVNEFRNVQFAVGSGDLAFYLRSLRKDSPASTRWAQVYTTDYKPTAADVGALTDAQAAQKYALRSIKVNGKPLSTDVNLLAGDVNAWNKTEADGRYVKRTGDTMSNTLNLPRVAFPSESAPPVNADDDLTRPNGFTLEQLAAQSKGYPMNGAVGNLLTFKLNRYRNVQFAIGSGNTDFYLRSMRDDNPETAKKWARVYTTDFKPTLTDVKAADHSNNFAARMGVSRVLTGNNAPTSAGVWSAENSSWAAVPWGSVLCTTNASDLSTASGNGKFQHYLQLAHEAGGKPGLRAAVNVNGTFSGWDSVMMSRGGTFTGVVKTNAEFQSTSSDNYRLIGGDYGSFWRNDGNALYLMLTNAKDQYGPWNNLRPFSVDVKTGNVTFAHFVGINDSLTVNKYIRADKNISVGEDLWVDRNATVAGTLKVGNSTHASDGNIMGSRWGNKWLWDAVIEQVNGRVDWPSFNQHVGARATIDWVNQNFIQNVRYSAEMHVGATGIYTYHDNTVLTGFNNKDGDYSAEELFWSYIQIYKNGQWITVGR